MVEERSTRMIDQLREAAEDHRMITFARTRGTGGCTGKRHDEFGNIHLLDHTKEREEKKEKEKERKKKKKERVSKQVKEEFRLIENSAILRDNRRPQERISAVEFAVRATSAADRLAAELPVRLPHAKRHLSKQFDGLRDSAVSDAIWKVLDLVYKSGQLKLFSTVKKCIFPIRCVARHHKAFVSHIFQAPVQSLEQLARQSRINYTVVANSDTHRYFINMKFAEDTLYRVWKEITLNSTSDQTQYRVWDYPIKEQYGHILMAINSSMPVENATVGFLKVNQHEDADFAFIHDSAEIKYEVTRNCNLTEVGEIFAEQPYAVAVQQGSHLQDEISRKILDLQKDRYFEQLSNKYWNQSAKGLCPNTDDSEGITLESLGGVFIATIFGLVLAMITLAGEIFYHKRKKRNNVQQVKPAVVQPGYNYGADYDPPLKERPLRRVTIGTSFRPVIEKNPPRVSYVSVFPRQQLHP
ncbi:uncharacterized protein LOC113376110 [Ctenocephalides felis]|uniref:uncharacterized protein LOC113376110 n=1 Tax=Ctenocephalides felis TaxID=7515 RepID=UPI000E6E3C2A|nr:uncharacterized protein LOC113376110 [Ctenocephalides felis]